MVRWRWPAHVIRTCLAAAFNSLNSHDNLLGWLAWLGGFFTRSLVQIACPPNVRTCLLANLIIYLLALLCLLDTRLLCLLVLWLIDWLTGWLTDWLTAWLIDWLIAWLIDWLTDWQSDWVIDWLIDWLINCVACSLIFNHYQGSHWNSWHFQNGRKSLVNWSWAWFF